MVRALHAVVCLISGVSIVAWPIGAYGQFNHAPAVLESAAADFPAIYLNSKPGPDSVQNANARHAVRPNSRSRSNAATIGHTSGCKEDCPVNHDLPEHELTPPVSPDPQLDTQPIPEPIIVPVVPKPLPEPLPLPVPPPCNPCDLSIRPNMECLQLDSDTMVYPCSIDY